MNPPPATPTQPPPDLPPEIEAERAAKRAQELRNDEAYRLRYRRRCVRYAIAGFVVAAVMVPPGLRTVVVAGSAAWVIFHRDLGRFRSAALLGSIAIFYGVVWFWSLWPTYCLAQVFFGAALGVMREMLPDDQI